MGSGGTQKWPPEPKSTQRVPNGWQSVFADSDRPMAGDTPIGPPFVPDLSGFVFDSTQLLRVATIPTGNCWGYSGNTMATTKATLVAGRISSIEAALDKLERELENAEGSRKQMLEKWVVAVHLALRKHQHYTLH